MKSSWGIVAVALLVGACSPTPAVAPIADCEGTDGSAGEPPAKAEDAAASDPLPTLGVDSKAVDLLKKSMAHLASLQHFRVQTQTTFEDLLPSGHRVDYETHGTATIERPNKLHTERHGNHINQVFFYDGESLTLFNPGDGVYAQEAAPDTLEAMFQFAHDEFGIGAPISDLVHHDPFPLLMKDVDGAEVIGREVIRGTHCTHLLFSRPGVEFQIWIADEGAPLPVKYVVTDTTTPRRLSIATLLSDWDAETKTDDVLFRFTPSEGARRIRFLKNNSNLAPLPSKNEQPSKNETTR